MASFRGCRACRRLCSQVRLVVRVLGDGRVFAAGRRSTRARMVICFRAEFTSQQFGMRPILLSARDAKRAPITIARCRDIATTCNEIRLRIRKAHKRARFPNQLQRQRRRLIARRRTLTVGGVVAVAASIDRKNLIAAVYNYVRALRTVGRTGVNTVEIAKALGVSITDVDGVLPELQDKGVRVG